MSVADKYGDYDDDDVDNMTLAQKLSMFQEQVDEYAEDARLTLYKKGADWTSDFADEISDILHDESKPLKARLFAMLAEIGYLQLLIKWGGTIDPGRN